MTTDAMDPPNDEIDIDAVLEQNAQQTHTRSSAGCRCSIAGNATFCRHMPCMSLRFPMSSELCRKLGRLKRARRATVEPVKASDLDLLNASPHQAGGAWSYQEMRV